MPRPTASRASSRSRLRIAASGFLAAAVVSGAVAAVVTEAEPAAATTARVAAVNSATAYAKAHGYRVGIAVLDTRTGRLVGNQYRRTTFASESVIKVMIAARLIVQGRMHGSTATRAKRMIKCSDDNIANSFYGRVGGDSLLSWTKRHFHVSMLGRGPIRAGWWGSNRITAEGLVRLYAKLKADRRIGPWLLRAMHAHTKRGCDGFDQSFGLPRAAKNVAVKQGWGGDYSYRSSNASQNSTGFVGGDRYAIAILARGPGSSYGSRLGNAITTMARRLLPRGAFPTGRPVVSTLSNSSATTAGGTRLTIGGREFVDVRSVSFGGTRAKIVRSSEHAITVVTPKHAAGVVRVTVTTVLGSTRGPVFRFVAPPAPAKPAPTKSTTRVTPTVAPTNSGTAASTAPTTSPSSVSAGP